MQLQELQAVFDESSLFSQKRRWTVKVSSISLKPIPTSYNHLLDNVHYMIGCQQFSNELQQLIQQLTHIFKKEDGVILDDLNERN